MPTNGDFEALCFYFNNWVDVPREIHTHMFHQTIHPFYNRVPVDSPFRHAVLTVAISLTDMWRLRSPFGDRPRKAWSRAISSTRTALNNPDAYCSGELIVTLFMLQIFHSWQSGLGDVFGQPEWHQRAAMALFASMETSKFCDKEHQSLSRTLISRYVLSCAQQRDHVDYDYLLGHPVEVRSSPETRLDFIRADMVDLTADIEDFAQRTGYQHLCQPDLCLDDDVVSMQTLLQRCLEIDEKADEWRDDIPPSWEPYRVTDMYQIDSGVQAAGLYNGLCDVYSSHTVSVTMSTWRAVKVALARLMYNISLFLGQDSISMTPTLSSLENTIQTHVDDICASLPFHLGDQTSFEPLHRPRKFPMVPSWLVDSSKYVDGMGHPTTPAPADFARVAAAGGGYIIGSPLIRILSYLDHSPLTGYNGKSWTVGPISLRPGQSEWLAMQAKRIQNIYPRRPAESPPLSPDMLAQVFERALYLTT